MAEIRTRSTDGSDADNGSTWALAKATLTGAAAIDAAGDTIWVSQAHNESTAAAVTIALAGTLDQPVRVICVNDGADPPTAVADTAVVATTGNSNISLTGACYVYGIDFRVASGTNNATFSGSASNAQTYERCKFKLVGTGASGRINFGNTGSNAAHIRLLECEASLANTGQGFAVGASWLDIYGGRMLSGTAVATGLFKFPNGGRPGYLFVDGFDMTDAGAAMNLVTPNSSSQILAKFRSCRLPASWSGSPVNGTLTHGSRVELWNCDSADTNYRLWIETAAGSIRESAAVYVSGWSGSDTAHSHVFTANSSANEALNVLIGPDLFAGNATVGSSVTATVEIVTDGVTLTDAECWLEVMVMSTSGNPLGTWTSDHRASMVATAANQTSSSQGWTTTGLTSPVKQKLSVSFTPQEAGYVIGRVYLAKASTTVYVDPELRLS